MTIRISNQRIAWYIILISLILLANYSLYHTDTVKPLPNGVIIGSFLDFMIVIPLTTYFLIIRKRFSIKYLSLIIAACYGLAWFIIPSDFISAFQYSKYVLIGVEAVFLATELFVIMLLIRNVPRMIRHYKESKLPFFTSRMEEAFTSKQNASRTTKILISELSLLYYSLFSWNRKRNIEVSNAFTYHKKTSNIALNIMLLHAIIIETLGLHFLLHEWNPLVSYILLIFNVYAVLLILAEIQAIRLNPIIIQNQELHIQLGLSKRLVVPIDQIESIGSCNQNSIDKKEIFDGILNDFVKEPPNIVIMLKEPIAASYFYGVTRKVRSIHLRLDAPDTFRKKLESEQY
ncbi:hypothetical protein [Bacillus sp. FJAT-49736]|uniref:hypothetical protein n=1 Tax=Bacillus sp. FJAT-49736 TaxID=2833582 RepID=UPI001BC98A1D|nr:hypothetical protein [Bacillus sp. FJAT-49736]MBS4172773.1 hypothetical protein [Bacillus sp. FJAT-49736]